MRPVAAAVQQLQLEGLNDRAHNCTPTAPSLRSYADLVDQLDGMTDAVVAAPPSHNKVCLLIAPCCGGLGLAPFQAEAMHCKAVCCRHAARMGSSCYGT